MTKRTKWILGGVAALAVSGLIYAMPALAAGNGYGYGGPAFGYGMMQARGGDMATMHNAMYPLMSQMPAIRDQVMGEVAALLDMTADDLYADLGEGKSLADIAAEKGVAIGQIRALMTQNMKAFLDQWVDEGSVTRAQAGRWLGFMEQNLDACLAGQMGGMVGMMGSYGMMGGYAVPNSGQ